MISSVQLMKARSPASSYLTSAPRSTCTVDQDIPLDVFHRWFLVEEPALKWFHSYLNNRTQVITLDGKESAPIPVACSVPQGSVLGPVQFISYFEDVVIVFNAHHHVQFHIFADDKQLFASSPVAEAHEMKKAVEQCVAAIKDWCASRSLKLNDGKTGVIWLGTRPHLQHFAGVDLNLSVGSDIIRPPTVVRNLGVFVDAELTYREHV